MQWAAWTDAPRLVQRKLVCTVHHPFVFIQAFAAQHLIPFLLHFHVQAGHINCCYAVLVQIQKPRLREGKQSTQGHTGRQQRGQGSKSGLGYARALSPRSHCSVSFQASNRPVYLCGALAARPGGQEQEEASCACAGWPRCLAYLRWRRA